MEIGHLAERALPLCKFVSQAAGISSEEMEKHITVDDYAGFLSLVIDNHAGMFRWNVDEGKFLFLSIQC